MDVEENADAGGAQEAHLRAVEPDGVLPAPQLLRDGVFQLRP